MANQELPLVPSVAFQRVSTQLEDVQFILDVRWNGRDDAWYMDLLAEDEEPIKVGMKITLGTLLGARSANAEFPVGVFLVIDTSGEDVNATFDDFGDRVVVMYVPAAEVADL